MTGWSLITLLITFIHCFPIIYYPFCTCDNAAIEAVLLHTKHSNDGSNQSIVSPLTFLLACVLYCRYICIWSAQYSMQCLMYSDHVKCLHILFFFRVHFIYCPVWLSPTANAIQRVEISTHRSQLIHAAIKVLTTEYFECNSIVK